MASVTLSFIPSGGSLEMDAELVEAILDNRRARWFDGLAVALARTQWAAIEMTMGLNRCTYGTGRYLANDPRTRRDDLISLMLPAPFRADAPVVVETLHDDSLRRYVALGLDFHVRGEIEPNLVRRRLEGAMERLGEIPAVAVTVGAILAAVHVAKPTGPDFDLSYSDPQLPFSIFVGIDSHDQTNGELRLTESILHECMHLQLTLIERTIPMIAGSNERRHSPWQGTMRPSQGILHGLYVFRVIQDFHRALIGTGRCTAEDSSYLARRIRNIEEEVAAISDFAASQDLTAAGKRLVAALLRS
jgi:HEXXH motif-containing protein